jgi:hypothetical protein
MYESMTQLTGRRAVRFLARSTPTEDGEMRPIAGFLRRLFRGVLVKPKYDSTEGLSDAQFLIRLQRVQRVERGVPCIKSVRSLRT